MWFVLGVSGRGMRNNWILINKVKVEFIDLDMNRERNRIIKDNFKIFVLSYWKNVVVSYLEKDVCKLSGVGGWLGVLIWVY